MVDIPGTLVDSYTKQKQSERHGTSKVSSLQTEKIETTTVPLQCGLCKHKQAYGGMRPALVYRPVMLSMVTIAAVCVCVALFFKSLPRVYMTQPFNWESLKYGSI